MSELFSPELLTRLIHDAAKAHEYEAKLIAAEARIAEARREALEALIEPTKEMIDAGAQRLARWEDGCTWPDSWDGLQVAGMRTDAERVWRSMITEALKEKAP